MHTVSLEYAQSHLAELLEEACRGEAVRIERGAQSAVRLSPEPVVEPEVKENAGGWPWMGMYEGKVELPEGWDEDLPLDMWEVLRP